MLPGHCCQQGHPWIAVAAGQGAGHLKHANCYAYHRQYASHFTPGEGRSYLGKVWAPATQPPTTAEAAPQARSQKPARARRGPPRVARIHIVLFACLITSRKFSRGWAPQWWGVDSVCPRFARVRLSGGPFWAGKGFGTMRLPQPRVWGVVFE